MFRLYLPETITCLLRLRTAGPGLFPTRTLTSMASTHGEGLQMKVKLTPQETDGCDHFEQAITYLMTYLWCAILKTKGHGLFYVKPTSGLPLLSHLQCWFLVNRDFRNRGIGEFCSESIPNRQGFGYEGSFFSNLVYETNTASVRICRKLDL
ncbi:hypothetical protein AVEN_109645-1 [Araneus ventricosus]|uniref:Uncharacterized protein n=1 Tax=Araneus ventricosus TaxID=182803 RepID=A0A4Y2FYG8_ARAVE|nr:hypothetical protein AVEN_109645-1 [Araneus ventricosus]